MLKRGAIATVVWCVAAGPSCLAAGTADAQSGAEAPGRLAFAMASIKPSRNWAPNFTEIAPGGQRFTATNTPLKLLIMTAYDVNDRHVSGGPNWLNSEFYNIEAKAERPATPGQIHLMLQALLAERFKLRLHRETKVLPMYILTVADGKPKLAENRSGGEPRVRRGSGGQTVFEDVPLSQLTWFLSLRLRCDVLDQTGLKGNYNFELAWTPDVPRGGGEDSAPPADPNGASVFAALREQLGLKLTGTKGPVDILVVDHAEKPSAN